MALERDHINSELESHFAGFIPNSLDTDPILLAILSALDDPKPRWNLQEITTFINSHDDIELNALELIPLLWTNNDKGKDGSDLLKLVANRASSKECLIALLEVQEQLVNHLSRGSEDDEDEDHRPLQLCLLLDLYTAVIPRIMLRKRGPLETLTPIVKGLSQGIRACGPIVSKNVAKKLLQSLAAFISGIASWLKTLPAAGQMDTRSSIDSLGVMLFTGVSSLCNQIRSHLAEGFIEQHFPRKYLHSSISPESMVDRDIMAGVVDAATSIEMTPDTLNSLINTSQNASVITTSIVLLAHWKPSPSPTAIANFIPHLAPFLQSSTAVDEVLFLLLQYAHAHATQSITTASLDSIIQPLVTLCSTCPDPEKRNTIWVTFSELFKTLSSAARLALLTELLSPETDPFPQMRVAAVGLVKDSVSDSLSAVASLPPAERKQSVDILVSRLLAQLGRYLLRPEPPELLSHPLEQFDTDAFLESSEPTRLHQCLSLYYMLLVKDVSNLTGVRDSGSISETTRYLLVPLAKVLDLVEQNASEKEPQAMIAEMQVINPLRMALARVQESLDTLNVSKRP